jgi:dihydroxyacetone kinase
MRKFLNSPQHFVDEMVEGLLLAHPDLVRSARDDNRALVRRNAPKQGKVGIITGGGSGHLPLFLGYVGVGLLDGVAIGDVFQSPSPEQVLDATRAVNGGAGVLYLYGNYGGDVLNFGMAAELAEMENIAVRTVLGADDVASMPPERAADRRGVAGIFFQYKCAGARAEQGGTLDQVAAAAEKAGKNTRSMGVALSACTIPAVGKPGFTIGEGEMEVGMGIHGEPGIERGRLAPADDVARRLVERILADMPVPSGGQVAVLVNGLGATPLEELYIISRAVHRLLAGRGIKAYRSYVGEYATSMEMAGLSVSVMALDDELRELVDAPFETPFHKQFASPLE